MARSGSAGASKTANNSRNADKKQQRSEKQRDQDTPDVDDSVTRCICGKQDNDDDFIQCEQCMAWQHLQCMHIDSKQIPKKYRCEQCDPDGHDAGKYATAKKPMAAKKKPKRLLMDTYFQEYTANMTAASPAKKPRRTLNSLAAEQLWIPDFGFLDTSEWIEKEEALARVATPTLKNQTDSSETEEEEDVVPAMEASDRKADAVVAATATTITAATTGTENEAAPNSNIDTDRKAPPEKAASSKDVDASPATKLSSPRAGEKSRKQKATHKKPGRRRHNKPETLKESADPAALHISKNSKSPKPPLSTTSKTDEPTRSSAITTPAPCQQFRSELQPILPVNLSAWQLRREACTRLKLEEEERGGSGKKRSRFHREPPEWLDLLQRYSTLSTRLNALVCCSPNADNAALNASQECTLPSDGFTWMPPAVEHGWQGIARAKTQLCTLLAQWRSTHAYTLDPVEALLPVVEEPQPKEEPVAADPPPLARLYTDDGDDSSGAEHAANAIRPAMLVR